MMRKSKMVKKETEKQAKKLLEMQKLLEKSEQEEKKLLDETEGTINELLKNNNIFCGVILTHDDLINVLRLALETKENIKIPFRLYYND